MGEPSMAFMKMREREEIVKWSEGSKLSGSLLYAALYQEIAADDDLFALSLEAPPEQLSGLLLLSAVHFLLLRSPGHELAAYYPSITAEPLPAAEAGPAFRAFCRENRAELVDIIRTHTLQTTSPDRAPQVLLALDHVSKIIGKPFSIVEVGCSAGLLLVFDHYRYQFPNGQSLGNALAEVVISSPDFAGDRAPVPTTFPQIVDRIGLDLNPVDVTDANARNWILGCSSPDRVAEFNSLRSALEYRAGLSLNIVAGNAMSTLPSVLDNIDVPVCVFHSRCLYQWPPAAQEAFSAMLKQLSQKRILHRVGIESNGEQSGKLAGRNEISHTIYHDGESETRLLGYVSRRGGLEWLTDGTA